MASYTHFDCDIPAEIVEPLERLRGLQEYLAEFGPNEWDEDTLGPAPEGWDESTLADKLAERFDVPREMVDRHADVVSKNEAGGDWESIANPDGSANVGYAEDFCWNAFDTAVEDALKIAGSTAKVSYNWVDQGSRGVEGAGRVTITAAGKQAVSTHVLDDEDDGDDPGVLLGDANTPAGWEAFVVALTPEDGAPSDTEELLLRAVNARLARNNEARVRSVEERGAAG